MTKQRTPLILVALTAAVAFGAPIDPIALQRQWARHDALQARRLSGTSVAESLAAASTAVGPPPTLWGRMCLLPACGSRSSDPSLALAHLIDAAARVRAEVAAQQARLDAVESALQPSSKEQAIRGRIIEQRRQLVVRSVAFETVVQRALTSLEVELEGGAGAALQRELAELLGRDAASDIVKLFREAEASARGEQAPILSADLSYVEPALSLPPLGDAGVIAAHAAEIAQIPALEDTTAGREVELSPEVVALATSLGTPKAAFDFVRRELAVEWYFGARQGSTETLRTRRANDADNAALLVALLRAQNVPSRFVTGTIELPLTRIAAQLGLLTSAEVTLLDAPGPSPAPLALTSQQRVLAQQALSAAGIPFVAITRAGVVNAVQLTHVWVEAFIPFEDYRGAGTGSAERQWVPLDAWFSGRARFTATRPSVDSLTVLGLDAEALAQAWLAQSSSQSVVAFFRGSLSAALAASGSGAGLSDAQYRVQAQHETLTLLPGSLPYVVVGVTSEGAFLPESLRQNVQIVVGGGAAPSLRVELPLHRLTGHRVVLLSLPATPMDEEIIALAGGLYRAPASLVQVVPVLRVDGREVARGTQPVGLGQLQSWSVVVQLPGGTNRRIDNELLAGNAIAIGLAGARNGWVEQQAVDPADLEGPAGRVLYGRAAEYANEWGSAEEELARYLQVIPVRPTANVVLVQNQLQLEQVLGQPASLTFKGLEIDADFRTMSPLELLPSRGKALRRLSGLEGSFREAQVLTDGVGEDAISSTRVLQLALAQGVPILTLNQANQATVFPQLQASAEIRQDVLDNLARGREVVIPSAPLTVRDWTGTGYIARDVTTEEGGYFLSGRISGGQTVVEPEFWQNDLFETLLDPVAPPATNDASLVARIVKLPGGNHQEGVVGKALARPVGVVVLTATGQPVKGVAVRFAPAIGSLTAARFSKRQVEPSLAQLIVSTDAAGRAFAWVHPDTNITSFADALGERHTTTGGLEWPASPNPELVTINDVQASVAITGTTLVLAEPFLVIGKPDVAAALVPATNVIVPTSGVGLVSGVPGLELQEQLQVMAVDQYKNRVANTSVAWSVDPAGLFANTGSRTGRTSSTPGLLPTNTVVSVTSGLSMTSFIPRTTAGVSMVTATAPSAIGQPLTGQIMVVTVDAAAGSYELLGNVPQATSTLSGVKDRSYPQPYVFEIFRNAGTAAAPSWVVIRGDEPGIQKAVVTMRLTDSNAVLQAAQEQTPLQVAPFPDTATNVVFWPRYLVNGRQTATFTAEIHSSSASVPPVTTRSIVHDVTGSEVTIKALSGTLATGTTPAKCDTVVGSDGLAFDIANQSSWPLAFRLTTIPDVTGEALLGNLGTTFPRYPGTNLVQVNGDARIHLPLIEGTSGGRVKIEVLAPEFTEGPLPTKVVAEKTVRVQPVPFIGLANSAKVVAEIILPVRNPQSTVNPPSGSLWPPTATEQPILIEGSHVFCVPAAGDVRVSVAGATVAEGRVSMTPAGPVVTAISPTVPVPTVLTGGALLALVPPGVPGLGSIETRFIPALQTSSPQVAITPFLTKLKDNGVLPVGHVFVKGVSVVDGHLVKQSLDLSVPGRGPSLAFTRSYSNRSGSEGVLGPGWSHSLSMRVIEASANGMQRYQVVGGEGSGQMFKCSAASTNCGPQQGYHGTVYLETLPGSAEQELVFRAKSGAKYRFTTPEATMAKTVEWRIGSVVDPVGNKLTFEYGDLDHPRLPSRVYQAGNSRFLEFSYVTINEVPRLSTVALKENPLTPGSVPGGLGAALSFGYDGFGRLTSASRAGRTETYGYFNGPLGQPELRDNLNHYEDPDGIVTDYEYYLETDTFPGEAAFTQFEEKPERVKAVIEPGCGAGACRTGFVYSLKQSSSPGLTQPVLNLYTTSVTSPRPGVPATWYWQDGYGATSRVLRPIDSAVTASSRVDWDPVHLVPVLDEDARGRRTSTRLDDFGNVIERRVSGGSLPGSFGAPSTLAVEDSTGGTGVVQKWSYDPAFGRPTCEMDAEGRLTLWVLDSNGANPRDPIPAVVGSGLVKELRRLANKASPAQVSGPLSCQEIALRALSSADLITRYQYCDPAQAPCPTNGTLGDRVRVTDSEGHRDEVAAFDSFGFGLPAQSKRVSKTGAVLLTTFTGHDSRGRAITVSDSRGQAVIQGWDELDRSTCTFARNQRGGSPGQLTTRAHRPSGALSAEARHAAGDCDSPGAPLYRRITSQDLRGRVSSVTESGINISHVTESGINISHASSSVYTYDQDGNRETVTDGRGVRTTFAYDFAGRPFKTTVAVGDLGTFEDNGGDPTAPFPAQLSTSVYDQVGNKISETDLHGFETVYELDSLYRVVETKLPRVAGALLTNATADYRPKRRYDLTGNVVLETDGNGHETKRAYDFAGRLTRVLDAENRSEEFTWDGNGNRLTQTYKTGLTAQLTRTTAYDGLNRPLTTTDEFAKADGNATCGSALQGLCGTHTQRWEYDDTAAGHATATRDARGFVTTTRLDDLGRPVSTVVDDNTSSLAISLGRSPDDARAGAALNLTSSVVYDALGNVAVTVDARRQRTETTWDGLGRVVSRALPLGVTEASRWNATGALISATDRRGVTREQKYDALGRGTKSILLESLSQGGSRLNTLTRTYVDAPDSSGRWRLNETDAAGSTTSRFTDAMGRVVTVEDARHFQTELRYDAKAQRRTRDAKGYVTETDTDAVYRPTAVREFDVGASTATYSRTTSYDDVARIETATDARGTATVLERDGLGRLTKRTRGSGTKLQVDVSSFNAGGQEVLHTDANGHQTQWVYDGAARKKQETKALGTVDAATWSFKYDEVGNELEVKGPRTAGLTPDLRRTYDGLSRAVRIEDALGSTTFRAYDGAGNLLCEKTANGDAPSTLSAVNAAACQATHVTRYEYEEEGQLTKVTTALGAETTYVWDASRKRRLSKQDGNLHLTTYEYDARAQRTAEFQHLDAHARLTTRTNLPLEEPLSLAAHLGTLAWRTTYDANGNVETQTDPLGQVSRQVHGLRNRLDDVTYSLHTTPRTLPSVDAESWSYDANGNVEAVTQAKLTSSGVVQETTTREYDVLDRLQAETRYDTKVTGYGYDAKGNRTRVTDFQNVGTTYTFDAQDRLKTAVTAEGSTSYEYFADGLPKSTHFFNNLHEGRCYDDGGRLTALVTAPTAVLNGCSPPAFLSRHRYTHDAEGNRKTQLEELTVAGASAVGPPELTEYGYDDESRLVGVGYPDNTTALYQLDRVGNRVGERKAPSSAVVALTAAAFLAVSPSALTSDALAVFNRADWLESVTDSRAPAKNATFEWDIAGNLRRQQTAARDRRFTWDVKQTLTKVDDNGIEAGRYDYGADGLRSKRVTALESVEYVLDGMQVLVETDGANSAHPAKRRYHYASSALAVTDISGSTRTTKALHLDALGSPATETTQAGVVAAVRQYDAWGQYRNGTAPGSTDTKFGYTGHQYDVETGLVYARARYYDAEYGRFLSRDSFEGALNSAPSLHRFRYAHGNPLRYTDPSGHFVPLVILGGIIAWEALVIHNEVTTGQGLTESNDALNQRAMKHFESEGIGALSSDASGFDTAAALTTTTGGQFAAGAFFGLPNLVLHPLKAAESAVRIPERFISGAGKVITGQGGESARLEGLGEMGGAFGEAALVAGAVRGGMQGASGVTSTGLWAELGRAAPTASVAAESFSVGAAVMSELQPYDPSVASMRPPWMPREASYTTKLINGDFVEVPEGMPVPNLVRSGAGTAEPIESWVRARAGWEPTPGRGGLPGSRSGKPFTKAGKDEVLQANADAEIDGIARCKGCGTKLSVSQQSRTGITPRGDSAAVDHYDPQSQGGSGDPSNGEGLCMICNTKKSDGSAWW